MRTIGLAFVASVLLAAAVGSASARNISSSNQNIRGTFNPIEFASSAVTVRCRVTLEGSFHSRTIAKVERSLIGAVTRAIIDAERCTNGSAVARNLPWHVTYTSFTGTLPSIRTIQDAVSRFRVQVRAVGLECEYGTETDSIGGAATLGERGEIISIGVLAGGAAHRVAGSFLCPESGVFVGEGPVTVLSSSARITITLI